MDVYNYFTSFLAKKWIIWDLRFYFSMLLICVTNLFQRNLTIKDHYKYHFVAIVFGSIVQMFIYMTITEICFTIFTIGVYTHFFLLVGFKREQNLPQKANNLALMCIIFIIINFYWLSWNMFIIMSILGFKLQSIYLELPYRMQPPLYFVVAYLFAAPNPLCGVFLTYHQFFFKCSVNKPKIANFQLLIELIKYVFFASFNRLIRKYVPVPNYLVFNVIVNGLIWKSFYYGKIAMAKLHLICSGHQDTYIINCMKLAAPIDLTDCINTETANSPYNAGRWFSSPIFNLFRLHLKQLTNPRSNLPVPGFTMLFKINLLLYAITVSKAVQRQFGTNYDFVVLSVIMFQAIRSRLNESLNVLLCVCIQNRRCLNCPHKYKHNCNWSKFVRCYLTGTNNFFLMLIISNCNVEEKLLITFVIIAFEFIASNIIMLNLFNFS